MKKYSFLGLLSIIVIAMQQAIFSKINIAGAGVEIVFVYVVCFALLRDEVECLAISLFCGIIVDTFFPGLFGINTITYVAISYFLCQIEKRIYKDAIIIPLLLTLGMSIIKALLFYVYFYISSIKFDLTDIYMKVLVMEPLYNAIICIFMYKLIKKISNLRLMQEEWKF